MQHSIFEATLDPTEKEEENCFKMVTANFLGSIKAENHGDTLKNIPRSFKKGCNMA
jgi:hypothetical protein